MKMTPVQHYNAGQMAMEMALSDRHPLDRQAHYIETAKAHFLAAQVGLLADAVNMTGSVSKGRGPAWNAAFGLNPDGSSPR